MILAIDPGSVKTGVALVHEDGELKEKRIIPTQSLLQYVQECYDSGALKSVVMGDGTRHESLGNLVKSWIGEGHDEVSFSYVNEKFTTVEGRKLYWQYTPRKGWRKFVPTSWQYPPEPVDDFVAWIIGLRYVRARKKTW